MKNQLIALAVFLAVAGCSPTNEVRIVGNIDGLADSTEIRLLNNSRSEGFRPFETSYSKGGQFDFVLNADSLGTLPRKLMLMNGDGSNGYVFFWVGAGTTTIKGSDDNATLWLAENRLAEQKELLELFPADEQFALLDHYQKRKRKIFEEHAYQVQGSTANAELQSLQHNIDSISRLQSLVLYQKLRTKECFSEQALDAYGYLFFDLQKNEALLPYLEEMKARYETLPDSFKNSNAGKRAYHALYPPKILAVGDTIIEGELFDTSGIKHPMSEFRGKYVLLDFWSTACAACAPCLQATPELKEVQKTHLNNLVVVGITLDEDKNWKNGTQLHQIDYVTLSDKSEKRDFIASFDVSAIPHYVLISPEGIIIDTWSGYATGSIKEQLMRNFSK